MKRLLLFLLALMPFLAFGQVKDSIRFYVDLNDCDVQVWHLEYVVTNTKGKVVFLDSKPIGYNKQRPCEGQIEGKDTATLVRYFKNTLLNDPSSVVADAVTRIIEQVEVDKDAERFSEAIQKATGKNLFAEIEKEFADSLLGAYRLRTNTGTVKTVDCTIMRRPNGQIVVRTGSGQNIQNYPIKFWGAKKMEVSNIEVEGEKTLFYLIKDKGRWSTMNRKTQILKSDKLAINIQNATNK